MNEASSKYVDQIAVNKLLTEKLNLVHHSPEEKWSEIDFCFNKLNDMDISSFSEIKIEHYNAIKFDSYFRTILSENDIVYALSYPTQAEEVKGTIIFIHGLYEQNLEIYNYFFQLLNKAGLNLYLLILPFHYFRKPKESSFSGEYFWSGNIYRNIVAYKQSVFDLYKLYLILKLKSDSKIIITGFSMGGGIGLTLASLKLLDGLFIINPVINISGLVWNSKLFSPVKNDLESFGFDFKLTKEKFEDFDPIEKNITKTRINRIVLGYGIYDQINDIKNYYLLIHKWQNIKVFDYKAGHLNILRVPKLAADLVRIFFEKK